MLNSIKYNPVKAISIFTMLIGLTSIVGWVANIESLTSLFPGLPTMKFNTALGFVLSGATLFIIQQKDLQHLRYVRYLFSGILMIMGVVELSQYVFSCNAGIDELFVADKFELSGGWAGRMAAGTALCFFLSGFALSGSQSKKMSIKTAAQYCLHVISLVSITAILGYLFKVPTFYRFLMLNSMALHTAITFFIFSIAAAFINPGLGLADLFTGKYTGNIMARKIFPRLLLGVIMLACLRIKYNQAYPALENVGIALFGLGVIIIGLFLIWHTSLVLNNLDRKRAEAEDALSILNKDLEKTVEKRTADLNASLEKLQQSEDSFRLLVEGVSDYAIYMLDPRGRIMGWNKGAQKIKGYAAQEIIGLPISVFYTPDDIESGEPEYNLEIAKERGHYEAEGWRVRKDGSRFWANIVLTPLYDQGELRGFSKITRDITGKKNAEEISAREAILVQTLPDAVVYGIKNDFKITSINKAAEELFGITVAAARGKRIDQLGNIQIAGSSIHEARKELWDGDGSWRGEVLFTTMDGRRLTLLGRVKTIHDYTGEATGWLAIYSDITALKGSEERLELAFEGTAAGLWDWDIRKDERWWSPRYFELLGYKYNELPPSRETLQTLIHPDDVSLFFTTLHRNFSKPGRFEMEIRYRTKTGDYKWFQAIGKTKFGENGEPLRMVGSILDIDEKKKAQQLITQQAELIKMLPDGIIYGDLDNRILSLNEGAEALFEVKSEDVRGKHIQEVISFRVIGNREANRRELMEKGFLRHEVELTNRSGRKVTLLVNVKLVLDIATNKTGWVCIYTDITPLRLNEELKEALRKLEVNNQYLEQLAHISAHDIKAPIIALQGLTDVLVKAEAVKPDYSDVMKMITDKIKLMERTNHSLNSILKLRKNLQSKNDEDSRQLPLEIILKEALSSLKNEISESNCIVKVDLEDTGKILFPNNHLSRILNNLIANAIKYRHQQRVLVVNIQVERLNNNIFLITVTDNGIGFDLSQNKDKLYGIFKRFHNHVDGSGVGLHIVKSIVDSYGGSIDVESEVGHGTSFKITYNAAMEQ